MGYRGLVYKRSTFIGRRETHRRVFGPVGGLLFSAATGGAVVGNRRGEIMSLSRLVIPTSDV